MTITYSLDVASATFVGIHKLLFRWKGSIWKSIYPEMMAWLSIYMAFSLTYRYLMNKEQRVLFENVSVFFYTYGDYIPITFMLGFYVSAVFGRWHDIFDNLDLDKFFASAGSHCSQQMLLLQLLFRLFTYMAPEQIPDKKDASPGLLIATYVRGNNEEARMIRRNVVRYMILVQAMVFRDISASVQKRFPTMDHLVTAGLMTTAELKEFDSITSPHIKYWTPIQWAFLLLRKAKDKKIIESDIIYVDMLEKIRQFRVQVLTLTLYDWVPIPLVYTQVVNLAVRAYFMIALLGRQFLNISDRDLPGKSSIDLFIPIMTLLQFLFYMGWMKVADVMLNPLGEDDDDFETNWIIDRNLQVGFSIVDDCYGRVPELEKDVFWEETLPEPLYTPESANRPHNPMLGSCNDHASQEDALLIQPRRRRLMSTTTNAFDLAHQPRKGVDEDGGEITQVENHNPQRRISVCVQPHDYDSHVGILDTVRRKFSKATAHHDSVAPFPESNHDKTAQSMNGRLGGSSNRSSVNRSSASKPHLPHDHFSSINQQQPHSPTNLSVTSLDGSIHGFGHKEDGNTSPHMDKSGHSSAWHVNEMQPIIEEVQERMRRNAKDSITESVHSSISNASLANLEVGTKFSGEASPQNDSGSANKDSQQKFPSKASDLETINESNCQNTDSLSMAKNTGCTPYRPIPSVNSVTSLVSLEEKEFETAVKKNSQTISLNQKIKERKYSTASSSSQSSTDEPEKS